MEDDGGEEKPTVVVLLKSQQWWRGGVTMVDRGRRPETLDATKYQVLVFFFFFK